MAIPHGLKTALPCPSCAERREVAISLTAPERYFGTRDLNAVNEAALAAGIERMAVDFGLATDRRQKFALWCLLFTLGHAPDVDDSFEDRETRDLARQFMELTDLPE